MLGYYGPIVLRQRTDSGKYREGTERIVLKTRLASATEPVTVVKVAAEPKHAGVRSLNPYGAFGRTTIVEIADSTPIQPEFGTVKYDCRPVAALPRHFESSSDPGLLHEKNRGTKHEHHRHW